jgi:hypothetical protein
MTSCLQFRASHAVRVYLLLAACPWPASCVLPARCSSTVSLQASTTAGKAGAAHCAYRQSITSYISSSALHSLAATSVTSSTLVALVQHSTSHCDAAHSTQNLPACHLAQLNPGTEPYLGNQLPLGQGYVALMHHPIAVTLLVAAANMPAQTATPQHKSSTSSSAVARGSSTSAFSAAPCAGHRKCLGVSSNTCWHQ